MGNCQAVSDVESVFLQHPDGRVERSYWPLSAINVMNANPGHYIALLTTSNATISDGVTKRVRYLKLVSPNDMLLVGRVYYIITFEDVLREFGTKKRVRLSKLMKKKKKSQEEYSHDHNQQASEDEKEDDAELDRLCSRVIESNGNISNKSPFLSRQGQWRPTLQTIVEAIGS